MEYSIFADDDCHAMYYYDYDEIIRNGTIPEKNGKFEYINIGWIDEDFMKDDN